MKKIIGLCGALLWALWAPAGVVVNMDLSGLTDSPVTRSLDVDTGLEKTYSWSGSSPLFNGPGGTAAGQKIYGGISCTGTNNVGGLTTLLDNQVGGGTTNNTISVRGNNTGGEVTLRSILMWDSADFLTSDSAFGSTSDSSISISYNLSMATTQQTRFIIRDGSTYYVSSIKGPSNLDLSVTLYGDTVGLQWASFDVNDWALYDKSDANLGFGSLSWETRTFDNVTGIGLLTELIRQNGNDPFYQISEFSGSLVPEPATMGLFGFFSATTLFLRRRHL